MHIDAIQYCKVTLWLPTQGLGNRFSPFKIQETDRKKTPFTAFQKANFTNHETLKLTSVSLQTSCASKPEKRENPGWSERKKAV